MDVLEWFSGFATLGGFLYFLTGFAMAYLIKFVSARLHHKRPMIPWHFAGIVIGVIVIMIVSLQSQVAYKTAQDTAFQVQQCQEEFNSALQARSRVTSENDELSQQRSLVVVNWIHELLFPPMPYSTMEVSDPARQDYGLSRTIAADQKFRELLDRQNAVIRERERHPLPDPKCGR